MSDEVKKGFDKFKIQCFKCQKLRHFKSECRSDINKEEKENVAEAKHEEASALLMAFQDEARDILLQGLDREMFQSNVWFLNIGATSHITGNISCFSYLDRTLTCKVKFGNASRIRYKAKRIINVKCADRSILELESVQCAPSFGIRLSKGSNTWEVLSELSFYLVKGLCLKLIVVNP